MRVIKPSPRITSCRRWLMCARSSFVQLVDGFLNGVGQLPASRGSMDVLWRPRGDEATKRHRSEAQQPCQGATGGAWQMQCWPPPETTDRELSQPADGSWMWNLGYDVWGVPPFPRKNSEMNAVILRRPWRAAACAVGDQSTLPRKSQSAEPASPGGLLAATTNNRRVDPCCNHGPMQAAAKTAIAPRLGISADWGIELVASERRPSCKSALCLQSSY
jgi:hypothetical protein